jgi:hypothetical protein
MEPYLMSDESAYRRLAIAILELDVPTLAARLADERRAEDRTRTIASDVRFAETAAELDRAA